MKKVKRKLNVVPKYPYPRRVLRNKEDVRSYFEHIVGNLMTGWLKIDGYIWYLLIPGDKGFRESSDAGACIVTEFPYRKFFISIQQDSIDKVLNEKTTALIFKNIERSMVHELLHVLFAPLAEIARKRFVTGSELVDAEETAVDHLSICIHEMICDVRKRK